MGIVVQTLKHRGPDVIIIGNGCCIIVQELFHSKYSKVFTNYVFHKIDSLLSSQKPYEKVARLICNSATHHGIACLGNKVLMIIITYTVQNIGTSMWCTECDQTTKSSIRIGRRIEDLIKSSSN